MLLTIKELLRVLRNSVNVTDPDSGETIDDSYLSMTDDDLILFIKMGVSRAYPDAESLDSLPDGSEYPVILLAKIELYTKLAVARAEKVNMSADGASLSLSDRFNHYMSLVEQAKDEYESWLNNEGQGTVTSYNLILSKEHYSNRNYENQVTPKVSLVIDSVSTDSVEYHWSVSNTSHFGVFKSYISTEKVFDIFKSGAMYSDKISEGATLVVSTSNIRNTSHRVEGLSPDTLYHLAVVAVERNQVFGYKEIEFTTLPLLDEEEVSVSSI